MMCVKYEKKDFSVKFRIILVFGVSEWGTFGKEIPEKITKTVLERTESLCFLELARISTKKRDSTVDY